MNFNRSPRHLTLIAAATAALLLSACGRDDNQTVGQKIDGAIATTERNVEQARTDASQKMAEAKDTAERATAKVAEKIKEEARRQNSPIVEDPPLARLLRRAEGRPLPRNVTLTGTSLPVT